MNSLLFAKFTVSNTFNAMLYTEGIELATWSHSCALIIKMMLISNLKFIGKDYFKVFYLHAITYFGKLLEDF